MGFGSTRARLLAGLGCLVVAFASLGACAPQPPASSQFCAEYKTAQARLQEASGWVDSEGNVDIARAVMGVGQLLDSFNKLNESAPPDVKREIGKVTSAVDELKNAALSLDQARAQKAAATLTDPALAKSLTDALVKAAKNCG